MYLYGGRGRNGGLRCSGISRWDGVLVCLPSACLGSLLCGLVVHPVLLLLLETSGEVVSLLLCENLLLLHHVGNLFLLLLNSLLLLASPLFLTLFHMHDSPLEECLVVGVLHGDF